MKHFSTPTHLLSLHNEEFPAPMLGRVRVEPPSSFDVHEHNGFLSHLLVVDRRESSVEDLESMSFSGTPLLVDDDGDARQWAPFVLDTIPGPRRSMPNTLRTDLLGLPARKREPDVDGDVLISFGGEDPAQLTHPVLTHLDAFLPQERRIWVIPPGERSIDFPSQRVEVLPHQEGFKHQLHCFGLVITSFGLTAWEALAAGCAVILINPSSVHESLSHWAQLPSAGFVSRNGSNWKNIFKHLNQWMTQDKKRKHLHLASQRWKEVLQEGTEASMAQFLQPLSAPRPQCAACSHPFPPVIARYPQRSFYQCPQCGMMGLYRFYEKEDEYGPEYFGQEYAAQYGRTYLEDFASIRALAGPRLQHIQKKVRQGDVLDLGCAYGPFLDAAREAGFTPYGADASAEAVHHVQQELEIPAQQIRFPFEKNNAVFEGRTFSVVTLWYVIEHIPRLDVFMEQLASLVEKKGVLALSTPNGAGLSGRKNKKRFLQASPADHYTIWTPRTAKKYLRRYGFKTYHIRVTGHHPERLFPFLEKQTMLYRFLLLLSRCFHLGDTFEIYAERIR